MTRTTEAHAAWQARGCASLRDRQLESKLFKQLDQLERTVDYIGPTPLRHRLSELIVEMRREIWTFDQFKDMP
jgi:hypothetical protein